MTDTPTREQVELALNATGYAARDVLDAVARLWLEGPQVDEAMIERAAKELIALWNEDGCQPIDLWGKDLAPRAERVLRAAWR